MKYFFWKSQKRKLKEKWFLFFKKKKETNERKMRKHNVINIYTSFASYKKEWLYRIFPHPDFPPPFPLVIFHLKTALRLHAFLAHCISFFFSLFFFFHISKNYHICHTVKRKKLIWETYLIFQKKIFEFLMLSTQKNLCFLGLSERYFLKNNFILIIFDGKIDFFSKIIF